MSPPLIAIVDDDLAVRVGVQRLLHAAGLRATVFPSGAAFLAALDQTAPDCVLLDIRMPAMTGFEVHARLCEARHRMPVIFMSAEDPGRCQGAAVAAGFAFLQKPFDGQLLLSTVHAALGPPRRGCSSD